VDVEIAVAASYKRVLLVQEKSPKKKRYYF
jgi:hypothetical protein